MRPIRTGITTLLLAALASLGYARVPAPGAVQTVGDLINGHAVAADAAQEPKPAEPKPPKETPEAKPPRAETREAAPRQQQKPDKDLKQDKKQAKEERKEGNLGGKNARIPDKQFKAHFGQEHKFRAQQVITTTNIVPNQTRFVYVGYTFVFLDPWLAGWMLTDDCYIDYLDGEYFLLDPFHPGIQVGLSVVM